VAFPTSPRACEGLKVEGGVKVETEKKNDAASRLGFVSFFFKKKKSKRVDPIMTQTRLPKTQTMYFRAGFTFVSKIANPINAVE
jgi:hypothetical protein